MKITIRNDNEGHCLVFEGAMTDPYSRETERQIFDSIRICERLKVDLSGGHEIGFSGTHLLGVLLSYSKETIKTVATSPAVEVVMAPLLVLWDAAMRARPHSLHLRAW